MVPLGGDNITNDISLCLKIPFIEAEKLKIKYGELGTSNIDNNFKIEVNAGYDNSVEIDSLYLKDIIEARSEEILYYAKEKIKESKYFDEISGVVIVGGGLALFKGINNFASKILDKSLRIGSPNYTGAVSPIYSTVVGIIKDVVSTLKIDKTIDEDRRINNSVKTRSSRNKQSNERGFVSKIKEFFTDFF
jgi:cell division protein FtsA